MSSHIGVSSKIARVFMQVPEDRVRSPRCLGMTEACHGLRGPVQHAAAGSVIRETAIPALRCPATRHVTMQGDATYRRHVSSEHPQRPRHATCDVCADVDQGACACRQALPHGGAVSRRFRPRTVQTFARCRWKHSLGTNTGVGLRENAKRRPPPPGSPRELTSVDSGTGNA